MIYSSLKIDHMQSFVVMSLQEHVTGITDKLTFDSKIGRHRHLIAEFFFVSV